VKRCGNERQMGGRRGLDGCASHLNVMAVVDGASAMKEEWCCKCCGPFRAAVGGMHHQYRACDVFILRVRASDALGISYRSSYVGYAPGSNGEKFPIQQSEDGVELCLNLLICVRPLLP